MFFAYALTLMHLAALHETNKVSAEQMRWPQIIYILLEERFRLSHYQYVFVYHINFIIP